jgi:hypothetical protein
MGEHAGARHLVALERLVHGEAEDHREALGEARAHGVEAGDPVVGRDAALRRVCVGGRRGLAREAPHVVRVETLRARAPLREALHHVADLAAGVLAHGALDRAAVVVRHEAREVAVADALRIGLELEEFQRAHRRVAGAASRAGPGPRPASSSGAGPPSAAGRGIAAAPGRGGREDPRDRGSSCNAASRLRGRRSR